MINTLLLQNLISKFTAEIFAARLAQASLVTKIGYDTKLKSLNQKINWNKTKHLLAENDFKKLQKFEVKIILKKRVLKII